MVKSKLLMKEATAKPLPPHIRKRLTFQGALLREPRKYMNSLRFERSPSRKRCNKKMIAPKPVVEHEETQTLDVSDAETNTKIPRFSQRQCSALRMKKKPSSSRSSSGERTPKLRGILKPDRGKLEICRSSISTKKKQKPSKLHSSRAPTEPQPGVKRRRGILKKSEPEVVVDGMCSQSTTTEWKKPHLSRILKENHIFMKYSNTCKPKKKRVRVDKKPVFSYLSKKSVDEDSVQSLGVSESERSHRVSLTDNGKSLSDASEEFSDTLERKPAHCVLGKSPTREDRKVRCVLTRAPITVPMGIAEPGSAVGVSFVVHHPSSAPELNALGKISLPPTLPASPRAPATSQPPRKKIPKERLYFKNFFRLPECKR